MLSDVDTNAGAGPVKPEAVDSVGDHGGEASVGADRSSYGGHSGQEHYWSAHYGTGISSVSSTAYHPSSDQIQVSNGIIENDRNSDAKEVEEEGGEVIVPDQDMSHYRDNTGPIRGYPGQRSDAFVWRPY